MHECSGFRSAAARRCCSEITHTSDPRNRSCAVTVSLVLSFSEAAHDGQVRKGICNLTVVCRLGESPARAHSTCTSLHFHCMHLVVQTHIHLFSSGCTRNVRACARRVDQTAQYPGCKVPRLYSTRIVGSILISIEQDSLLRCEY